MTQYQVQKPVLFIVYNRPDLTAQVFEKIAQARPTRLFLAADGPKPLVPSDEVACAACREIVSRVDWPCQVEINFAEANLGLQRRVSSALDWVFTRVDDAIILEDDCLPSPSFFRFCDELLERYAPDERIMAVSGNNFQAGTQRGRHDYYFSRYNHLWGWATWRRAWALFDYHLQHWPEVRDSGQLAAMLEDPREFSSWTEIFNRSHQGLVNSWGYRWTYSCWVNSGLSILPQVNLVSNIGFGEHATHTKDPSSHLAGLPAGKLGFPLRHPPCVLRHVEADAYTFQTIFS